MAGAKAQRSVRGKYTTAGYASGQPNLYIARYPAGSAQENLRDLNLPGYGGGYRSERPWREEAPKPTLQGAATISRAPDRPRPRKDDLTTRVMRAAKREKQASVICVLLLAAILMIVAVWGQKMIEGVRIQNNIAGYQRLTAQLEQSNERLSQQLEQARSGERIRNLAQNELGMLRPERSQHETIYIHAGDLAVEPEPAQSETPRMELLDVLLGLLNVFHIGE